MPVETITWKNGKIRYVDQTRLPHEFIVARLTTLDDATRAIREMWVRGAPLIGAAAAYGVALAMAESPLSPPVFVEVTTKS